MKDYIFYLGVGTLFTHELDAMSNSEWLVLPLTSWLPEQHGELVFVLFHIPLFAVLIALMASQNRVVRVRSMLAIAAFMVIHGVLHALFASHEHYEFDSMLSNVLIFGSTLCGVIYLALHQWRRPDTSA